MNRAYLYQEQGSERTLTQANAMIARARKNTPIDHREKFMPWITSDRSTPSGKVYDWYWVLK